MATRWLLSRDLMYADISCTQLVIVVVVQLPEVVLQDIRRRVPGNV